jgi:RNA polymerase sigma factor (TIGR02999 family)
MADFTGAAPGFDQQFAAIYEELRRLASAILRGSGQNTLLNPTALVNEAFVKLASSQHFSSVSPLHLKRAIAQVMRQILVDYWRRKQARGGEAVKLTLDDQVEGKSWSLEEIIVIGDLIDKLRALKPRLADIVECRFYLGLTNEQIAAALGVSTATVEREWPVARAWLEGQMG